jgi:nucleotide sugar dehydrogenase
MRVAVVGLGKIGLPLSVQIAGKGHHVVGLDINSAAIATILAGGEPFPGEPDLKDRLNAGLAMGTFTATTDPAAAVTGAEVVIVVVPLIVDPASRPDYSALDAATTTIAPHLAEGVLVSYETTLPIGATRDRFTPALELGSGRRAGIDLFVSHSPERVSSGRVFRDLRTYPKLVGGIDPESTRRAVDFYASALDFDDRPDLARANGVWDLGSAEAAELAKLAETTYRDINIAFANELAVVAEQQGLDVWAVIDACNSQPYSHIHQPGIAVGGHCIPVYPHFLLADAPEARLPAVAREINSDTPRRCVERLGLALGGLQGATVLIVGVAYRAGVKEHAFSGAFALRDALAQRGAIPVAHDPMYDAEELRSLGFEPWQPGKPCDGAIIHTPQQDDARGLAGALPGLRAVLDGRHSGASWAPSGVPVIELGRPAPASEGRG